MKEVFELELYPEIQTYIDEVAYFFAKEVKENNCEEYTFRYMDDVFDLLEHHYNVRHAHNDIMAALQEACEHELFVQKIFAKPVKIQKNLIIFEK